MAFLRKIWLFTKKKREVTEYSRGQFWFMCIQLIVYGVGLDLTGLKIYSFENQIVKLAPIDSLSQVYFYGLHGLFLALGLFRLFELYWYAKDVNKALYTVT